MVEVFTQTLQGATTFSAAEWIILLMRNVIQLKGNKLGAVLGTAEMCQLFIAPKK
jgi:hypothetical protein